MNKECGVCLQEKECIDKKYINCTHNMICNECFVRSIKMCYCRLEYGEFIHTCPYCRDCVYYENAEVYGILKEVGDNNNTCDHDKKGAKIYVTNHEICSEKNTIRECEIKSCGCLFNIKEKEVKINDSFESVKKYMEL
jgi:hypothetical protein